MCGLPVGTVPLTNGLAMLFERAAVVAENEVESLHHICMFGSKPLTLGMDALLAESCARLFVR